MQPEQKTALNFSNFFKLIYSPYVWKFKFGCRSKYLPIPKSYGASKSRPLFVFSISERPAFVVLSLFLKSFLKLAVLCEAWGRGGKMSKYYIPRDHVIRHVVIRGDTDEFLDEETASYFYLATYCII